MAEGKGEVKLLSIWASPFAIRVLFALELGGIPYQAIEQDFSNRVINQSQLLLESNPVYKKIPVLLHDDKPICESGLIVEYIDAVWNTGWLPKDPHARAEARFWGEFVDSKLIKAALPVLRSTEAAPVASKEYQEACILLEEHLLSKLDDTKPFVGGDQPNYVDIMLANLAIFPVVLTDPGFGLELPSKEQCPRYHKLMDALRQHPAAKAALPEFEKMKATYCWFFKRTLLEILHRSNRIAT